MKEYILSGARVYLGGTFHRADVYVQNGRFAAIAKNLAVPAGVPVISCTSYYIFPGLTDVHVHLREPGFSYKATVKSETAAAARGGYTTVCAMPNLKPAPDAPETLKAELSVIRRDASVHVLPYGTITAGRAGEKLSDMEGLAPLVFGYSDDGSGVQSESLMEEALRRAKALRKPVCAHCEMGSPDGAIHDGEYAAAHGIPGISSESEWEMIRRDIGLVRRTGAQYHVCHISTKESVDIIREAKREGLPVTCETAPHYLVFTDASLKDDGAFRMNPPIRAERDREALIEGILDGTIDMIATDHAPHSAEEKSGGLRNSVMGVVGLETALSVMYTEFVRPGLITKRRLMALLHDNAKRIFGIGTDIEAGAPADFTVFDPNPLAPVNTADFRSAGKSSPFAGRGVFGRVMLTAVDGDIVWSETDFVPKSML